MTENQFNNNDQEVREWQSGSDNWAVGIALILVGSLFMLDTLGILDIRLTNWWAIFILIPGLSMAVRGWRQYQVSQSRHSRSTGFWGLFLILLAFSFFFNIAWELIFPVALIGGGIYLLIFR
ncbi:MAG: DUF5668 domain-containing protein [Anaerolineales bacterium]|jgi:hypothetical protein